MNIAPRLSQLYHHPPSPDEWPCPLTDPPSPDDPACRPVPARCQRLRTA